MLRRYSVTEVILKPLRDVAHAELFKELDEGRVVGEVVPLQQLVRPLLHWRVLPPLTPAQTFRVVPAHNLAEEPFLRVIPEKL